MKWVQPEYSKKAVNRAGKALAAADIDPFEVANALDVLNNWRASHALPLNAIKMNLLTSARRVCARPLVAQRLKRTPSTVAKLRRFSSMQLARMQDIGGCRAVVANAGQVIRLYHHFLRSRTKHKLVLQRDYMTKPKESGYRGVHLVYRYQSSKYTDHVGLMIEIQLRSKLQHVWATGVETVGAFIRSPLKSSIGPEDWLRYFSILGSLFAIEEKGALVPGTPETKRDLVKEALDLDCRIRALERLEHFGSLVKHLTTQRNTAHRLFLMHLKPTDGVTMITGYTSDAMNQATADYLATEKEADTSKGEDVVLVTADSVESLRRAYPNYFMDTRSLVASVVRTLGIG
jgi:hypothetical protein